MPETAREHVANALSILYIDPELIGALNLSDSLRAVETRLRKALEEMDAGNVAPKMKGVPR